MLASVGLIAMHWLYIYLSNIWQTLCLKGFSLKTWQTKYFKLAWNCLSILRYINILSCQKAKKNEDVWRRSKWLWGVSHRHKDCGAGATALHCGTRIIPWCKVQKGFYPPKNMFMLFGTKGNVWTYDIIIKWYIALLLLSLTLAKINITKKKLPLQI